MGNIEMVILVLVAALWVSMVEAPYTGPSLGGCHSIVVEREGCNYDR